MVQFNGEEINEVPMVYDVEAVKVSVRNILTWRVGESVLRPDFGHKLNRSMYAQNVNFNREMIGEEIKRAIEDNEPRAKVVSIGLDLGNEGKEEDGTTSNALHVQVVYKVVGSDGDGAEITEQTTIFGK